MALKRIDSDVEEFFVALDVMLSYMDFHVASRAKHEATLDRIHSLHGPLQEVLGAALTLTPPVELQDSRTLTAFSGFLTSFADASGDTKYVAPRLQYEFSRYANLVAVQVDHVPAFGLHLLSPDSEELPADEALTGARRLLSNHGFIAVTSEQLNLPYSGIARSNHPPRRLIRDGEPKTWRWPFFGY